MKTPCQPNVAEYFCKFLTHPKREVAKGDPVVSKAIAQLQNFLIKVREQVSWQQEEITESGETDREPLRFPAETMTTGNLQRSTGSGASLIISGRLLAPH